MSTWLLKLITAQINLTLVRAFLIVLLFLFSLLAPVIHSQTSGVKPTQVPGSNYVTENIVAGVYTYSFFHSGIKRYEYKVYPGPAADIGSFKVIKAYDENNTPFLPSHGGGVSAILSGAERNPWDPDVRFSQISTPTLVGNTVEVHWQMNYGYSLVRYRYKLPSSD